MGGHLLLRTPASMTQNDPVLEAYQRELAYVFHALRWLGARSEEIEDLAQEVFIALRRSWPHYDAARPLRPYLFGIAFRVVSMARRRRKREVAFARLEIREVGSGADEALHAKQTRALVLRALEKVPLRRRAVLVMHDLDEVPMVDVAAALSIPLFTAYSRLRKARKDLESAVRRIAKEATEP